MEKAEVAATKIFRVIEIPSTINAVEMDEGNKDNKKRNIFDSTNLYSSNQPTEKKPSNKQITGMENMYVDFYEFFCGVNTPSTYHIYKVYCYSPLYKRSRKNRKAYEGDIITKPRYHPQRNTT